MIGLHYLNSNGSMIELSYIYCIASFLIDITNYETAPFNAPHSSFSIDKKFEYSQQRLKRHMVTVVVIKTANTVNTYTISCEFCD